MGKANDPVVCKMCGQRKTRHPSGLCARCQRKADTPIRLCVCCGQRRTRDEAGLCYQCRNKSITKYYDISRVDEAIERTKTVLAILEKKRDGASFRDIGAQLGIPKTTVSNYYRQAIYNGSHGESKLDTWEKESDDPEDNSDDNEN